MKIFLPMLIALFFLIAQIDAQGTLEPKNIGTATAIISLDWQVDTSGQSLSELEIKTFGFNNYVSQKLVSETTTPFSEISQDPFRNKIRTFNLEAANVYQSFSLDSELEIGFNYNFPAASDSSNYVSESQYVKLTAEIKEKANQIASNYASDLEKAVAISQWVHNNVVYDKDYINVVKRSDEVFSQARGTCDEFSHLFIAMLRSQGIPAKFSASYVYSGEQWGPHAFVEVAIGGKWMPFDPTFNEGVILDATHIKFGEGKDQGDIKEDISIRGTEIDVSKVKLSRQFDVKFKESENFPQLFHMQLLVPPLPVGEGSIESIKVKLINGENKIAIPLALIAPKEITVLGRGKFNQDKLVLLGPFEEKEIEWQIQMPSLEEGFDYKFPIKVESLGQNQMATIKASKKASKVELEDLKVLEIEKEENGDFTEIIVTIKNFGNLESVGTIRIDVAGIEQNDVPISIPALDQLAIRFSLPKMPDEVISGRVIIETKTLQIEQPFRLNAGPSTNPTNLPLISATPTNEGNFDQNTKSTDFTVMILMIILVLAAFFAITRGIKIK